MTKEERHEMIMEALIKYGSVQVSDLVTMLDVSAVTVRKDLTDLEKSDRLYRSHGKAVLINRRETCHRARGGTAHHA